jgi:hypothetical protein
MGKIAIRHYGDNESLLKTPRITQGELWQPCFTEVFHNAPDTITKGEILKQADKLHKSLVAKGNNYCKHLLATLVRENLKAYYFSTTEIRDFGSVLEDFNKWWEENPKLRKARIMAEYL